MILHCPGCGAAADPEAPRCPYCTARLAMVACPSCFAHMFAGSRHCPGCGSRAARVEHDDDPDRCPACRVPTVRVGIGPLRLSECPRCDGLWLDGEDFERLCADGETQAAVLHWEQAAPRSTSVADPVRYRPCPRCGKFMNRVNFARMSGVVLDVCRSHGTWFDRRELHQVIAFIRGGGMDRARERQREMLAEQERRLRAAQMGRRPPRETPPAASALLARPTRHRSPLGGLLGALLDTL